MVTTLLRYRFKLSLISIDDVIYMSDSDWLTVYGKIKTKWKNMIYCQNYILENVFSVNALALKSVKHTLLTPLSIKNRGNFLTKSAETIY